jgi:hypothetical protein
VPSLAIAIAKLGTAIRSTGWTGGKILFAVEVELRGEFRLSQVFFAKDMFSSYCSHEM